MYSTWTVPQLKGELKKRGGTLRGKKADLVSRLESFDRNLNFGIPAICETEDEKMQLPAPELYHDINSSSVLPSLTKFNIRMYFRGFNKKPDEGLQLYESRFILIIRSYNQGDFTFIKAITKASMKRLQYEVNIKLHTSGNIEEACCECTAGSGTLAHCKHIATALFGVEHMVREKIILKHLMATEKLQQFHVPKSAFTSTPIQSTKLPSKRKRNSAIFAPYKEEVNVQKYNERFKQLIQNCKSNIPFKQLCQPANPHGIDWDHSYCGQMSQNIIKDLKLENVTAADVNIIEAETIGQSANPYWKQIRAYRITSSKFHTICHLRPNNLTNYARQLLVKEEFKSQATTHGLINESVALQQYMNEYELDVYPCGVFISQERPYLAASPDGLLGLETVIEIKCPFTSKDKMISDVTVPYLVKDLANEDDFMLKYGSPYCYQIQGQLYCTGRQYCNLVIYTYKDLLTVFVSRDEDFISQMLPKLDHFYLNYFKPAILNKLLYKDYTDIIKRV